MGQVIKMSWKNVLKKQDEEDERSDIHFKLEGILEDWTGANAEFDSLNYMTGHPENVLYGNEELVADIEFENNSEDDLEDEEAWEADEGFFIIQFYTYTDQYDIARYNLTYNEGLMIIESVDISKIPIHIARKLVN